MADAAMVAVHLRASDKVRVIRLDGNARRHLLRNPRVERLVRQHGFERHRRSRGGYRHRAAAKIEEPAEWDKNNTDDHSEHECFQINSLFHRANGKSTQSVQRRTIASNLLPDAKQSTYLRAESNRTTPNVEDAPTAAEKPNQDTRHPFPPRVTLVTLSALNHSTTL